MAGFEQSVLSLKDIYPIHSCIKLCWDKWEEFGDVLKIAKKKLQDIHAATDTDDERKMFLVLTCYLQDESREYDRNVRPTKQEIVDALKKIGAPGQAMALERISIGTPIMIGHLPPDITSPLDPLVPKIVKTGIEFDFKIAYPRNLLVCEDVFYITYKGSSRKESCVLCIGSRGETRSPVPQNPYGIAMDEEGNIYVTDRGNHKLYKYDKNLQLIEETGKGSAGRFKDEFCYPHGVSYINGLVYVCDNGSGRVKVYDKTLDLKYIFGDRLKEEPFENKTLFGPTAIAGDSKNNLYVSDNKKMAVVKFRARPGCEPTFATNMGQQCLRMPSEIAIDNKDIIYVTDRLKTCIVVFGPSGDWLTDMKVIGMQLPRGLAFDPKGPYLFVADYKDTSVNVWKLKIAYKQSQP